MNNDEKKLIEDLFSRLYKTEIKSVNRDDIAEKLIKDLLEKYPNSPYYMAQTILIQETAIKKLNEKISFLNNNNVENQDNKKSVSNGFLSNIFGTKKSKNTSDTLHSNKNVDSLKGTEQDVRSSSFPMRSHSNIAPQGEIVNNSATSGTGFLGGALQTAAGVAGGVVMANMLMNLFQHKKPEEEIMDASVHNVDSSHDINSNSLEHDSMHSQYISDTKKYTDDDDNNTDNSYQSDCDSLEDSSDYDICEDDDFV
ncbi:MAG: DUF2076 domain-containing protein [Buchnera aphidicola (Nurudea yanoniella)]